MRAPPTGTVTFLFTDIEGSTHLWERSPATARRALGRHEQILRRNIEANGGHIFKTLGDGVCAAFATAPEALAAALAAQIELAAEPWETETPLRVRMALHTGGADERDGDYYGHVLNRASRLMAAGHGGQTLLSLATEELTRDTLPDGAALRDLGDTSLKDLSRPERVFQLLHPSLPSEFPSLRSLGRPDLANNLPQQPTSFIGREKEIAQIKALAARSRLVTLAGTGGAGKSRLSLKVAADVLDQFPDGAWFVELAPLADPALVPQNVAHTLGVREEAGKPVAEALAEWLKDRHLLLVLDNCEHLVAACASLATDLLRHCPHVHLLTSSREPLNVAGEQTFRVPSLSLPDPNQPQTVESLSQFEAVALFIDRAQAVQPAFSVTDRNAPAVANVCWRLDGIPLAIELAAARARSLSVEEINSRLDNRFRLLTGGSRASLPRQQTLRALIDWSYDLLTAPEKAGLCRISVFAGGWRLDAAEAVCASEEGEVPTVEAWEVLDLLTALADKSLVAAETAEEGTRYRLLETVRQYAAERLQERDDGKVRDRHLQWCLALAEEAEPELKGSEQGAWLARLEAEHDNLRAALVWCEQQTKNAEAGLRLAGALGRFWMVRGHWSEGRLWLNRALEHGAATDDATVLQARAKALHAAGGLAFAQGEYPLARSAYEESLALRRQLGEQQGIANSLNNLGLLASEQGDYAAARQLYEESLLIERQLGNQQGIGASLHNLGNLASNQGEYGQARRLLEESLTLRRRLGDQRGIANSLNDLGSLALEQGEHVLARKLHEEGLTVRRRLGDQRGIAISLHNLGNLAFAEGELALARKLFEECLALYRRLGDQRGIAHSLSGLGDAALGQGEWAAARALLEESLTLQQRMGDQRGIVAVFVGFAGVAEERSQPLRAARLLGATDTLRETIGAPLSPMERVKTDKHLAAVRSSLAAAAFAEAWEAGRAMTLDEAIDYALHEPD